MKLYFPTRIGPIFAPFHRLLVEKKLIRNLCRDRIRDFRVLRISVPAFRLEKELEPG